MKIEIWYMSKRWEREWDTIPHLGELIKLEEKYYEVVTVSHKMDEGIISIITSQLEGEPRK